DGAAELGDAARTVLDDVVERVEKFKPELVVALGFTDGKLSAQRSHLLSLERAEAVKAYLASKGVERNRIYAEGKGSGLSKPNSPPNRVTIELNGRIVD
ncbi:MAG: OmpA family protein, partial [Pseudomonadota bacterium]